MVVAAGTEGLAKTKVPLTVTLEKVTLLVEPSPIAVAAEAALVAVHKLVRLLSNPKLLVTEKPNILAMSVGFALAEVPAKMAPPNDVPPRAVRPAAAVAAVRRDRPIDVESTMFVLGMLVSPDPLFEAKLVRLAEAGWNAAASLVAAEPRPRLVRVAAAFAMAFDGLPLNEILSKTKIEFVPSVIETPPAPSSRLKVEPPEATPAPFVPNFT